MQNEKDVGKTKSAFATFFKTVIKNLRYDYQLSKTLSEADFQNSNHIYVSPYFYTK